ncbi:DUF3888 domain-containing protein [Paenibacillus sp. NEAU-GSW1]|uniref:DUF3888 domain-containing protein n=1 Tax=Paenibacillus sp. NEAU-GSW1 TaxID=2682486 RepID=UPI0012E282EA|nr:DUF3888 domain-containing protein [Paenibacillus sp. NEAU-GSW1]MUT67540.1 DUF3888 domain-containing protein [Paenibacillus sp. NEAU-GSW1]
MKLYTAIILILFLLLMRMPSVPAETALSTDAQQALADWLEPSISSAVAFYYSERMPYMVESISRPYPTLLTAVVTTFQHAHNPPYGQDLITFRIDPSSSAVPRQAPKLIRYLHNGDDWQLKLDQFKNELVADVQAAFQLELRHAQKYEFKQLLFAAERRKELLPLVARGKLAIEELLPANPDNERKTMFKNTVYPIIFLNEKKRFGYMLLKQSNGTNVVIRLAQATGGNWQSGEEKRKPGKPLDHRLLWYMQ